MLYASYKVARFVSSHFKGVSSLQRRAGADVVVVRASQYLSKVSKRETLILSHPPLMVW
jgi:hypothetical protein